jgi:hypothetical protein
VLHCPRFGTNGTGNESSTWLPAGDAKPDDDAAGTSDLLRSAAMASPAAKVDTAHRAAKTRDGEPTLT